MRICCGSQRVGGAEKEVAIMADDGASSGATRQNDSDQGASRSFEEWVRDNGGDDELIELLKANGFTSKLSLGNVDFKSPDASLFVDLLNYGQKCLLQGLVKLLNKPESAGEKGPYSTGASKAAALSTASKSSSLKEKIGKMFHLDTGSRSSDFQPTPSYPKVKKSGTKRAAPISGGRGKGPMKKKVKQMKLKIVGLPKMSKHTPTGTYRDQLTHYVWINLDASEEEAKEKIVDVLGWRYSRNIQYLYAQGKNLRKAMLSDVENAESWDLDTLRALMGSGALYVLKPPELESDSESNSDDDFISEKKSVSVRCTMRICNVQFI